MGAASDSFILLLSIAGPIALLTLVWTLVTRLMNKPKDRGFLQRFPILLPAAIFIILVVAISQIGILPMAQYRGANYINTTVASGNTVRFDVYEPNDAYSDGVQLSFGAYLVPGESMNITIRFFLGSHTEKSINATLIASGTEGMVTEERTLEITPGIYMVQVNNTYFDGEIPEDMVHWVHITLSQPVNLSFANEIVTWSSFQFGLIVGCFFLLLGGFCIGGPSKSRYPEEDEQESEWIDYGGGGPEYGKGC
jgi:hypothetical protein